MNSKSNSMNKWAVFFYVVGVIFFVIALYKLFLYENSRYSPINAYVEGDAYNFIINAGRAIAYFVVSMGNIICGVLSNVGADIVDSIEKNKTIEKKVEELENDSLPPL